MSYFKKLLIIGVVLISTTINSFALKAEYRFENCDGSATTKNNQSSLLNGVLSGDAEVTLNNGKIKNALTLSGDGMMSIKHNSNLDLIQNLTITFWVNPKEKKRQALIVKGDGGGKAGANAEYSLVLWEDGKFKYKHNNTADIFSKSNIPLNKWTYIALVRDNSAKSIKIYINGVLDANRTYTIDPSSSNTEKLLIGTGDFYSDTMKSFNGKLDEIKIYNLTLSKYEISNMYETENSKKYYTKECASTHKAPEAVNDSADLPIDGEVVVDVLSNDIVYDSNRCELNSSTVKIVSNLENSTISDNNRTLTVKNQGIWSVTSSGSIKFVSNNNFYDNPTDISYIVTDSCKEVSNKATVTLTRVAVTTPTPVSTPMPLPTPYPTATKTPTVSPTPTVNTPTPTPKPTSTTEDSSKEFNIGDRVWYDKNKNGIQDSGEDGVNGVIVVLYNNKGAVVERTTTNASGEYLFKNIKEGTYSIGFSNLPKGYIFTSQNMGSDNSKDSDASSSGRVSNIKINKNDLTYDAGIILNPQTVVQPTITDNNSSVVGDCDCNDYESSVPALNKIGVLAILILVGLLGTLFIKEEEFNLNIK